MSAATSMHVCPNRYYDGLGGGGKGQKKKLHSAVLTHSRMQTNTQYALSRILRIVFSGNVITENLPDRTPCR